MTDFQNLLIAKETVSLIRIAAERGGITGSHLIHRLVSEHLAKKYNCLALPGWTFQLADTGNGSELIRFGKTGEPAFTLIRPRDDIERGLIRPYLEVLGGHRASVEPGVWAAACGITPRSDPLNIRRAGRGIELEQGKLAFEQITKGAGEHIAAILEFFARAELPKNFRLAS